MLRKQLKRMFSEMVVKKNVDLIQEFYHPDFILYTNGQHILYQQFVADHKKYYASPIEYYIDYDEESFVESDNKIAARVWITTKHPPENERRIEVILIAEYCGDKIRKLWELTYPDWSQLPGFKE